MIIAFTRNSSLFSKLIRWAFDEPVSHVVFVFDSKFVIHSNLLGVQFDWFKTFKKKNQILISKKLEMSLEQEETVYQGLLDGNDEEGYDFRAFWYFAYRALLYKAFKTPMPSKNKKNGAGFLCTEMYGTLPEWLVPKVEADLSITTPYQLAKIMGADNES